MMDVFVCESVLLKEENTYQGRKRRARILARVCSAEPGTVLAVHLGEAVEGQHRFAVRWLPKGHTPVEVGSLKMPKWDTLTGTWRCGNLTKE